MPVQVWSALVAVMLLARARSSGPGEPLTRFGGVAIFVSALRAAARMDFLCDTSGKWAARWRGFAMVDDAGALTFA